MGRYLARRLAQSVGIIFLVVTATFVAIRIAPGDPFLTGGGRAVPPEVIAAHRARFGVDRPIGEQYLTFLRNVATGDFGQSFTRQRPVTDVIAAPLANTLVLGLAAMAVNFAFGAIVGLIQARRRGSRTDHVLGVLTLTLFSVPLFWLGILAAQLFAVRLGWFPSAGVFNPATYEFLPWTGKLLQRLRYLTLPALTVGLVSGAWTARYMRAAMIELMEQPYVRTARAKGLTERDVLLRHVLRNAAVSTATLLGLYLPILFSGSVFAEQVFTWNGLGRLAAGAVRAYDYPVVTATAILTATIVVAGNLVADLLYRIADPRIARPT